MDIRRQIAGAHGISEVTVRSWANGARKHPYSLSAIEITETMTGNRVTRHDLRPDIFGKAENSDRVSQLDQGGTGRVKRVAHHR